MSNKKLISLRENINLKKKKGITLIALIITIIVLLILAGVTVVTLTGENGLLGKATTSRDENEKEKALEEIKIIIAELQIEKKGNTTLKDIVLKLQESEDDYVVTTELETSSLTQQDGNGISNANGITNETNEIYIVNVKHGFKIRVTKNLEVSAVEQKSENEVAEPGKTANTTNRTLSGSETEAEMTYKNPIIPKGFSAVNIGNAKWEYKDNEKTEVKGWNNGLVIQDGQGNQFVWVPCTTGSATNEIVKYQKVSEYPTLGDITVATTFETNEYADDVDDGKIYYETPVTESAQVAKYGGFYVGRFEAGIPTTTTTNSANENNVYTYVPVVKYGAKIWNYIKYKQIYVAAAKLVDTNEVKSGLITGTQWDTIMQWLELSNINVGRTSDSLTWGTYRNLDFSYTGNQKNSHFVYGSSAGQWQDGSFSHTGFSAKFVSKDNPTHYHAAGLNSNGYTKNIADLAGNFLEVTTEKWSYYTTYTGTVVSHIARGTNSSSSSEANYNGKACYRENIPANESAYPYVGFRIVLYITTSE